MKYFIPQAVDITDSSIPENQDGNGSIIHPYDITAGYDIQTKRYYEKRLWEVTANKIHPLAHLEWNDHDPLDTYAYDLHTDQRVADPTAVPVVNAVTVVFVHTSEQYYIAKVTANIDFTTEDHENPANFTLIGDEATSPWRYHYQLPAKDSIYWKDLGATNRHKCSDQAVNTQSIQTGTSVWWEFNIRNISKVVLFNIIAKSAKITLYTTDIQDPVYENEKTDLLDTTSIVDWRTLSQYEPIFKKNIEWILPWLSGDITCRITIESPTSAELALGEILQGEQKLAGKTLDGVNATIKSSGKITEQENGEVVFADEGNLNKVFHTVNFNIKYDSQTIDSMWTKCDEMINRRIVITAEDKDEAIYKSLVIYGFIRDVSPSFEANNIKSKLKIQIQRFI